MLLNEHRLLRLGHQRKFDTAVVEQCLAKLTVFEGKEILQILRGGNGRCTVAANRLEQLQHKFCRLCIGACTNQ